MDIETLQKPVPMVRGRGFRGVRVWVWLAVPRGYPCSSLI